MVAPLFFSEEVMRYHLMPTTSRQKFGKLYFCNHPVYNRCTLFIDGRRGLAVIQQYYSPITKHTWWAEVEDWITAELYLAPKYPAYFDEHAAPSVNGIFPTVSVRQMMWALRIKPLPRKPWETLFDHHYI